MKVLVNLFLCIFYVNTCLGQLDSLNLYETLSQINYTPHDGIAQMQVTCLFQDSKSYLWIGTREGLNKYDGKSFTTYRIHDGLPHNVITNIAEDTIGNIWICTRDGLSYFNGVTFSTLEVPTGYSNQIEVDSSNTIWLLNRDDNKLFEIIDNTICDITSYFGIPKNSYLAGIKFVGNKKFISVSDKKITSIYKSIDKTLKYIQNSKGAHFISGKGDELIVNRRYLKSKKTHEVGMLKNDSITYLHKMNHSFNHRFFYSDSLFYRLAKNSNSSSLYVTNLKKNETREYKNVKINLASSIIIDNQNSIWFGSDEGLIRLFKSVFTNINGPMFKNVWSIIEDDQGIFWLPSYTEGLHKILNNEIRKVENQELDIVNFYMRAIKTKSNELLFPNNIGTIKIKDNRISWIDSCKMRCLTQYLYEDVDRNLILSASFNSIRVIDSLGNVNLIDSSNGLHKAKYYISIEKDENGNYWFGSELGLSNYDYANNRLIENYSNNNSKFKGVISILKDKNKNLWFGTDVGLFFYDFRDSKFKQVAENLIKNQINSIAEIRDGYLVIGTVKGLYILNSEKYLKTGDYDISLYNQRSGFLGIEPTENGMFLDSNKDVWIPCQNGIVKLNSQELIERIKFDKSLSIRIDKINNNFFESKKVIKLKENISSINVELSTINYSNPLSILYSYKLNSEDWSKWQSGNKIQIDNLSQEFNSLTIRAKRNIYDQEFEFTKEVKIETNLDLLFKMKDKLNLILGIFFIISLLYLLYKYFESESNKKAIQRTNLLIKEYELKSLESKMNPHFIFNALSTVSDNILRGNRVKANQDLVSFSELLRYFFGKKNIQTSRFSKIKINETYLSDEINFIREYLNFEKQVYKDFDFKIKVSEMINLNTQLPAMIIQPFIENAVNHGLVKKNRDNFLEISFYQDENLNCSIIDNGVGIGTYPLDIKFEDFAFANKNSEFLKARIKLLKSIGYSISINILSTPNIGTKVFIKFNRNGKN